MALRPTTFVGVFTFLMDSFGFYFMFWLFISAALSYIFDGLLSFDWFLHLVRLSSSWMTVWWPSLDVTRINLRIPAVSRRRLQHTSWYDVLLTVFCSFVSTSRTVGVKSHESNTISSTFTLYVPEESTSSTVAPWSFRKFEDPCQLFTDSLTGLSRTTFSDSCVAKSYTTKLETILMQVYTR